MQVQVRLATGDADYMAMQFFFVAFFHDLAQFDDNIVLNVYGLPCWKPSLDVATDDGPTTVEECALFNWWIRDRCLHYLITVEGVPAGFALVLADGAPPLIAEIDFELMDFYIAPKYRRRGIGRTAARMVFDQHRGRWQVFQLARNAAAIAFWHGVIGDYTNGNYQNLDRGTEERFDNRSRVG